jgi:DNA (cytosine-5)-methyltransferase 1
MSFVEVCAGCGGLSSGLIRSGLKPIILNEIDKKCCETLRINHPEFKDTIKCCSMNELDLSEYKFDILCGGVPCQSFSQSGKRKGLDDKRGDLILKFIDMINKYNPKIFMIENVKGLLTHNKGETLQHILSLIDTEKYNIKYKILNALDYEVAQKRERLIIVGTCKKRIKKEYEFPKPLSTKLVLRDVLFPIPKDKEGLVYSEEKKKVMRLVPPGGCWIDLPEEIQKSYMKKSYFSGGGKRGIARRLSLDEPSLTLMTSPSQKQTERCHPKFTRPLNIREYARIQSFPDEYMFAGSINQKYKQIGNAVPVKLAEHVGKSLLEILNQ